MFRAAVVPAPAPPSMNSKIERGRRLRAKARISSIDAIRFRSGICGSHLIETTQVAGGGAYANPIYLQKQEFAETFFIIFRWIADLR